MSKELNLTEYQQLLMDRYAGTAQSKFEEGCLISLLLGPKEYGFEEEMMGYLNDHPDASIVELDEYSDQFFPELEVVDDDELDDEED